MGKKIIIIILAAIILGVCFYIALFRLDDCSKEITTSDYLTQVEFVVMPKMDFSLVISKNKKVSNIFIFTKNASFLYDSGIEGKSIEEAVYLIVEKINAKNLFTTNNITLVAYDDNLMYNRVREQVNKDLVIFGINATISDSRTSLEAKASSLGIDSSSSEAILKAMSKYSANLRT